MIKELFVQNVGREIETVVKADDLRNVDLEIREYVITNEIDRKIGDLFSEYGRSSTINGVWIHGFFGSGKSHLLKILSYVFENRRLDDGTTAAEIFASKTKDSMVRADIDRVSKIPSESILFNIDHQATISHNEEKDSVLLVFYKVFYDHLGFYGTQAHIAEFEWWVRFRKNIYEEFKERFFLHTGKAWIEERRNYFDPDVVDGVAASLAELLDRDESDFLNVFEDIEAKQSLSVEDLTNRVKEYINSRPKNFHLNFFIDEVGQFIAGDVNMMLNLQTIAESLAIATGNRSWVFATAQSAIEGLGEDLRKTQDYARILGRFKIQINLTSANVDEVIEKRLLEKKIEKIPMLQKLYDKERALIETIISSSDGGMPIVAYKDEEDFICKYPFFYYQFSLFQSCRISLAEHDVFQGKHASVGERNMLGVFQSVLKEIQDEGVLTVASFDKMYKGIEKDLRAEFVTNINNAESNLNDELAIKVLKTLFLVKYYKQFLATKENIAMLLINNIHIDIKIHQERVNRVLSLLEYHAYIERNGEIYEFLTNKEKDIETEIRNTEIEESKVNQLLKELFFDEVIRSNRIRYQVNKHDYEFTPKLDGAAMGRERDLSIEVISPNNDLVEKLEILKSQTMGMPVLRLVTESNREFMDDVRMYIKIQRYNALNQSATNSNETRSILYQKLSDNTKRKESLRNRADTMLGAAKAFVNGTKLDLLPKKSGQNFVVDCFRQLIQVVYPNLRMLGDNAYSEDTFKRIIQGYQVPGLFDNGDASISEAETQIVNLVERRRNQRDRTSLYDLKNHFAKTPFGWYENATFSILAKLYKKNKVEITLEENPLDDNELINVLLNSAQHGRSFIVGQMVYTSQQIKVLKGLYRDLFDRSTIFNDAKDVGIDFKNRLNELANDVSRVLSQKGDFKFVSILEPFYDLLKQWSNKSYNDIITEAEEIEKQLLAYKEKDYDPIKAFINGQQATIYRGIVQMVNSNTANINYVDGDEFQSLNEFLAEQKPYYGNALREAEEKRLQLREKVEQRLRNERKKTMEVYENELMLLKEHPEMVKLTPENFTKVTAPIIEKLAQIKAERFIGNLQSDRILLASLVETALNRAVEINTQKPIVDDSGLTGGKTTVVKPAPLRYINKNNIPVSFSKKELATEEDVDAYLEALKHSFVKQIKENRRIRI